MSVNSLLFTVLLCETKAPLQFLGGNVSMECVDFIKLEISICTLFSFNKDFPRYISKRSQIGFFLYIISSAK